MNVEKLCGHLEAAGFTVEYGDVGTHFGTSDREVHLKTEYRDPDLNITADIDLWLETDGAAGATSVLPLSRLRLHTLPMVVNSDVLFWMRFRSTTAPREHLHPNEMHGYLPVARQPWKLHLNYSILSLSVSKVDPGSLTLNPISPTSPTNPTHPTNPTNPLSPINPISPMNPINPIKPYKTL